VRLKKSQIITMGAKALESFVSPNGWMRKRTINIAQDTPMIVELDILGVATSKLGALYAISRWKSRVREQIFLPLDGT
jgi:hypothetical protein